MEELSVVKRNWSELPGHLLDIIMDKLSSPQLLSDYIRFGAVCDSWNSAFCDHDPPPHQFPPLLLTVPPPTLNKKKKTRLRRFYNISEGNIDGSRLEVRMPRYRHCRGSSHGWLITVDDDEDSNFAVRLFNPFLSTNGIGIEILLPSLKTFPISRYDFKNYSFLKKAVLSDNPLTNPTDYTVMAIYGPSLRLAFFKPGNKRWTSIKSPKTKCCKPGYFTDIIYCHAYGKFFVVNWEGEVVAVSDEGKGMIAKLVLQPPLSSDKIYTKKYLILGSSGRELLQVHRFLDISKDHAMDKKMTYATTGFRVFKLIKVTGGAKEEEEYYEWQEVKSLCGDSMFLGHNTSISIRASDYPGCKPNSIHYTDDSDAYIRCPQPVSDIGIFNLEDGSFKRHLPIAPKNTSAPIWIQPSLPNKNRRSSSSSSF